MLENWISIRSGINIVISAPSAVGKSTIIKQIIQHLSHSYSLKFSISTTSRPMRKNEQNNVDYEFITKEEFQRLIKSGDFIEYTKIFDNFYGTRTHQIINNIKNGIITIFDVNWEGLAAIKNLFNKNTYSIFILPPSLEELQTRIYKRTNEPYLSKNVDIKNIEKRLNTATNDIMHSCNYDYLVINDNLELAIAEVQSIILACYTKTSNILDIDSLIKTITK